MPYSSGNGLAIHYEVSGEGPPLVLIHANPFDHQLWLYQAAHFSTWFRVISIDIRGYGRSDKPTDPFTLEDMANDVVAVCHDEDVHDAIVAGVSVGSGIALLLALDHPELVRALVLVGGNSGPGGSIERRIAGYAGTGVDTYHGEHLKEVVAPDFPTTRLGAYLLGIFAERGPWLSGDSIGQIFRARAGTDMTPRLDDIAVPTLVVNGEFDKSRSAGHRTASLIAGARHRVLPGTGHACNIEDPAAFDAAVLEFLQANGMLPTSAG
jgi:pimeloyl-ACP methyl ester carboxylesterase